MERMHRLEAVGAIAYVLFAMLGIFAGYNFCRNILWNSGSIGDLWSSGTIALMNYAVGFKVLTGVGFLLLLVIYLLGMDEDHEFDGTIPTTEQEEGGLSLIHISCRRNTACRRWSRVSSRRIYCCRYTSCSGCWPRAGPDS